MKSKNYIRESKLLRRWQEMIKLKLSWGKKPTALSPSKNKILSYCSMLEEMCSKDFEYIVKYEYLRLRCKLYRDYESAINRMIKMDMFVGEREIGITPIAMYSKYHGIFVNKNDIAFQKKYNSAKKDFSIVKKTRKSITVLVRTFDEFAILKITNIKKIDTCAYIVSTLLSNTSIHKGQTVDAKILNPRHYIDYNETVDVYETNKRLTDLLRGFHSMRYTEYVLNNKFGIKISDEITSSVVKEYKDPDRLYFGKENIEKSEKIKDFMKRFHKVDKNKFKIQIKNVSPRNYPHRMKNK